MKQLSRVGFVLTAVLAVVGLGWASESYGADKKPDATVTLTEGSVAAGIGWSWGHGTLHYMGKDYRFKIEGLTVGEVGMTTAKATGNVYDLKSLDDFDGVYGAAGAGIDGPGRQGRDGPHQHQEGADRPHEPDQGRNPQGRGRGAEGQAREVNRFVFQGESYVEDLLTNASRRSLRTGDERMVLAQTPARARSAQLGRSPTSCSSWETTSGSCSRASTTADSWSVRRRTSTASATKARSSRPTTPSRAARPGATPSSPACTRCARA